MTHLVPCPGCSRHVKTSETSCPFCSAPLELSDAPTPVVPGERLRRSALREFSSSGRRVAGILLTASAASCSATDTPVYGAPGPPISFDAGATVTPDANAADAGVPPKDASTD